MKNILTYQGDRATARVRPYNTTMWQSRWRVLYGRTLAVALIVLSNYSQALISRATLRKLRAIVAEDDLAVLDVNNHIELFIVVHIAESQRDRYLVIARCNEVWPDILVRLGGVASWQLDDDHLPVQVEGDEMAGVLRAVIMANNLVGLEEARIAIDDIVVLARAPGQDGREGDPQRQRRHHADAHVD